MSCCEAEITPEQGLGLNLLSIPFPQLSFFNIFQRQSNQSGFPVCLFIPWPLYDVRRPPRRVVLSVLRLARPRSSRFPVGLLTKDVLGPQIMASSFRCTLAVTPFIRFGPLVPEFALLFAEPPRADPTAETGVQHNFFRLVPPFSPRKEKTKVP